jgi:hypothetical protein
MNSNLENENADEDEEPQNMKKRDPNDFLIKWAP